MAFSACPPPARRARYFAFGGQPSPDKYFTGSIAANGNLVIDGYDEGACVVQ